MKSSLLLAAPLAFICALPASAATFVNGGFDNGLTGYDLEACAFACDRDPGPFFSVGDNSGDPFLRATTSSSALGVIQASASQEITIKRETAILDFDVLSFGTVNDPGSAGGSLFKDALSVVLFDAPTFEFFFLFDVGNSGFAPDPFANPRVSTQLTAPSDGFFQTGVRVDLTRFIGETLTLGVFAFSESDGTALSAGFDNFRFSPARPLTAIPLPAGLPLLLSGLGLFAALRRRRPAFD